MKSEEMILQKYLPVILLIVILTGIFGYGTYIGKELLGEARQTHRKIVANISNLNATVDRFQDRLQEVEAGNTFLQETLFAEEKKNALFAEQIGGIASTVGILQKLSETDAELLEKYSKVYFLNDNYIPDSLSVIQEQYVYPDKDIELHTEILPKLYAMLDAAEVAGMTIQVVSGYRSFGEQSALKKAYTVTYGSGANSFSADQGYSEHQLGTAIDVTIPELGNAFDSINETDAYIWLTENAHKYGFTLSYPGENAYYIFEPWHWRYVGVALATKLYEDGIYLYSVPQWEIDAYLVNIFD